jgi:hypothetical protein
MPSHHSVRVRLRLTFGIAAVAAVACLTPVFSAYKGHADDRDIAAVLTAYPEAKGTPLDACATCHTTGPVKDNAATGKTRIENHCDYCHTIFVHGKQTAKDTLNRYGLAYLAAGRGAAAVRALGATDSDGDGIANDAEFKAGTNPGDATNSPLAALAPAKTVDVEALRALVPVVDQTIFVNSTKSRSGDSYSDYRGLVLWDVLNAVGAVESFDSVDVLSVDGYEHTFSAAELKKAWPQGAPVTGLGRQELGGCGWVTYGAGRLEPGKPLPEVRIMLALEENGQVMERARVDPESGRLLGKSPRTVAPQFAIAPPDLSQTADASCTAKVPDLNRFHEEYDHNAGAGSSAVVAVRVRPLPKGTRDIDWLSTAARTLEKGQIVFFGGLKK